METFHLRLMLRLVGDQCEAILRANDQVQRGRALLDAEIVWDGLTFFLSSAANAAKAFWGSGPYKTTAERDRREFRELLGMTDDSPIAQVLVRNHFEHIDERIDQWWRESDPERRVIIDRVIMPADWIERPGSREVFRVFDHDTQTIHFWEQSLALQPIVDEANRILDAVPAVIAAHPLPTEYLEIDAHDPPSKTFVRRAVRIVDLADPQTLVLEGFTFTDCRIIGPAVLMVLDNAQVIESVLRPEMMWRVPVGGYLGGIGLRDVTFTRCEFRNIGLLDSA